MNNFFNSFRSKLLILFFLSTSVFAAMLIGVMTTYFSNSLSSQRNILIRGTLNATGKNINTYLDDLDRMTIFPYMDQELLNAFKKISSENIDSYTWLIAQQKISESIQFAFENNRDEVNSVLIIYPNGQADYFNRFNSAAVKNDYNFNDQEWFKDVSRANGQYVFLGLHQEDYLSSKQPDSVFSVGRVIKDIATQKDLAVLIANANNSALNEIIASSDFGVSSIVTINDNSGNPVYSSSTISDNLNSLIAKGNSLVSDNGKKYMLISKPIDKTNWIVNVLMSYAEIQNKIFMLKLTTTILVLLQLLGAFLIFSVQSKSMTKRFSDISHVMQVAKSGDLSVRYNDRNNDEISTLGHDLNDMISQLNDLILKGQHTYAMQKSAEYKALQSQINPHFLYNTLNGFLGLNRLGEKASLEKAILSLSGLMRYVLEHAEYSSLEDEFSFIEKYCNLQKLRFDDRLKFVLSLEPAIKNLYIPKLLLQPLVENAIIHGIEPSGEHCLLKISAASDKISNVIISIEDNGIGFNTARLDPTHQIGISNVRERLLLSFPHAVFNLSSEQEHGTKIEMIIPIDEMASFYIKER